MRWIKMDMWKASIVIAVLQLLLVFIVWVPVTAADTHERASGLTRPGTITAQATPTEDATVAALNKEKLIQEVNQQQRTFGNWLWSNAAAILSSLLSTLVVVIAALVAFWQWRVGRKDAQDKELKDREAERDKRAEEQKRSLEDRAEERFQVAVVGLGNDKESARIGAAILLRTFLRKGQGYEQFYVQTFDLAVANLRHPRNLTPPEDIDGLLLPPERSIDTPLPLTTLSQALIVAFKEAFPLTREWLTKQYSVFTPQMLDATGIQLDNAYLSGTDLKLAWMPLASMRAANLSKTLLDGAQLYGANLSGAFLEEANFSKADLNGANLSKANLSKTNLSGAQLLYADFSKADFSGANLSGAFLLNADLSKAKLLYANLSGAFLEEANLCEADLNGVHLSRADLSKANLNGANLSEADLYEADLGEANLRGVNIEDALSLKDTNLRGVKGLTHEQLATCRAKGAIIDDDSTASASQSTAADPTFSSSNNTQASLAPSYEESTQTLDAGGSNVASSGPSSQS